MKSAASISIALIISAISSGLAAPSGGAAERKVIYHGWSTRDSAYVRDHWAEMEQLPFDGIGINIALDPSRPTIGEGSTGNLLGWQVFGAKAFNVADFQSSIDDLRKPAWTHFTDNFLPLAIATRDQDQRLSWFDDARWATIEQNWRVLLTIAREGHCRGLLLDPEHYDYECELFNYAQHRSQRADRPFVEYQAQARARGRQLGVAIHEIFPRATIGLLYGYTLAAQQQRSSIPAENARYALLPAFFDGLLESSAPDAKFVDLSESTHGYKRQEQFAQARREILNAGRKLSSIPTVYATAITAGMSLRIDYPHDGKSWQPASPQNNYFTPAAFQDALRAALAATDRYVWIYSEDEPQIFAPGNVPTPYLQALRTARQPGATSSAATFVPLSVGLAGALALGLCLPNYRARRRQRQASASMRILMVTGIFPPDRGGPASYVPKMATALTRRGHEVQVVCLSNTPQHPSDAERPYPVQRIHRRLFWPSRIVATTFAIWRAARSNDLVYVNGLGFESAIATLLARRSTVHKVVGDYAWERAVGRSWYRGTIEEYQRAGKTATLRLLDFIRSFPLRHADRIVVPSTYLRGIVGGWGIAAEKIRVVSNAVAVTAAPIETGPALPPWSGKTLITVCRLVPWKGVDDLIRTLAHLPETRLMVAGDGHLRRELEIIARSINVQSRVIFLGDVPQELVAGYLAQADAFVLNSTYEGLPHVVLEAIAAATPVIATDAGGTGELVQHDVTGLLVPAGDNGALQRAIERLWREPALAKRLAAEATERSRQHFDFEAMVDATEATLRSALPKGRATNATPAEAIL